MDNKTDKKTKTQKAAEKSIKEKEQKLVNNTPKTLKKKTKTKTQKDDKKKKETVENTTEENTEKDDKKITKKRRKKKPVSPDKELTQKEKAFVREYIKTGNGLQSIKKAGYNYKTEGTCMVQASKLIRKPNVAAEIRRLNDKKEKKAIMDANEVMELFSAIARGEVKDQFGLDATLNDRLKAMQEIAKRTIDIDNRIKGVPDNSITIKLDWKKE